MYLYIHDVLVHARLFAWIYICMFGYMGDGHTSHDGNSYQGYRNPQEWFDQHSPMWGFDRGARMHVCFLSDCECLYLYIDTHMSI
jgi:hypothetical protein